MNGVDKSSSILPTEAQLTLVDCWYGSLIAGNNPTALARSKTPCSLVSPVRMPAKRLIPYDIDPTAKVYVVSMLQVSVVSKE